MIVVYLCYNIAAIIVSMITKIVCVLLSCFGYIYIYTQYILHYNTCYHFSEHHYNHCQVIHIALQW